MQVADGKQGFSEARDGIKDALVARGHAMVLDPSEERAIRVEGLQGALEAEIAAGMDPVEVKPLSLLVLETWLDAFGRTLAGMTEVDAEPMQLGLERDPPPAQVQVRPRQRPPEKMDRLERQMRHLQTAGIVQLNQLQTCARVTVAVPKGRSFRMADCRMANA